MNTVKLDLNNASVTDKLKDGTTILDSTKTRVDLDPERTSYATAHAALAQAEKDLGEARQKARELKIPHPPVTVGASQQNHETRL